MKKEISSLQNPHWKRVCALSQRKYREQYGAFLVEGARAVEVILQSADLQYEIWATETGLQVSGLTIAEKTSLFIVPSKMFKALAQTESSQEIAAVVKIASLPKETDTQSGPIAVLCGVGPRKRGDNSPPCGSGGVYCRLDNERHCRFI